MAKLETTLNGDFDDILQTIESGILNGSFSATLEEQSDIRSEDTRVSVRAFERYSMIGGNRLGLTVVLFEKAGGPVFLTAVTTGGSSAVIWKINHFGEDAFLDRLADVLSRYLGWEG